MYAADRVTLARLPSGTRVETTVHTYAGTTGPTVYVQAAQHGREVNGTEVLRRLHPVLEAAAADDSLAGTVVAVPVADPLTFDRASYTTPAALDAVNPNMNRVWPGDETGSLHERMAARLWPYVADADAVVDLHTGSPDVLTHVVYRRDDAAARDLARAFGTDLLLAEPADEDASAEWHARDFAGKLRVAAGNAGLPAITPELAHKRQLVEPAIETGVTGVANVLAHLGLRDAPVEPNGDSLEATNHLGRVLASDSGLFRPDPALDLGQDVAPGDPIGTLYDPTTYDVRQEATADRAGLLYSLTREATVTAGDPLAQVAEPIDE